MSWAQDERGLRALTCDVCRDGWYDWDGDLWFSAPADLEAFAIISGWKIGDGEHLCPTCSLAQECARSGHRWGAWEALPAMATQVHFCVVCMTGEYR